MVIYDTIGHIETMTVHKPKRPRDSNQLAKSIVDIATGELPSDTESTKGMSPEAKLGRIGGLKGGKARARVLTPQQRSDIARKAAAARWNK